jgi:hypothetical protein
VPLSRPALLADHHDLDGFCCGVASLDEWLRRRSRANQVSGASRTYVVAEDLWAEIRRGAAPFTKIL